jgi:hypothetical protein
MVLERNLSALRRLAVTDDNQVEKERAWVRSKSAGQANGDYNSCPLHCQELKWPRLKEFGK